MIGVVELGISFGVLVIVVLALDLGLLHRQAHEVSLKEAASWTAVWVALALLFNIAVYFLHDRGGKAAMEFLTGYLVEWSLSMDNVFVFAVIFSYFAVPRRYQHNVLFWGIMGAVVMRLSFILIGVSLLQRFEWVIFIFGAIVLWAGIKMFLRRGEEVHPERNPVLRLAHRLLRVTKEYEGQKFFVRREGTLWATPLFLVLLVVEATDVVFAVDSIPAILAITRDPFIVFTSNVFAILGLRALYFLLAGMREAFEYLDKGLAFILCFIGTKMLAEGLVDQLHGGEAETHLIPTELSLLVVVSALAISIWASLARRRSVAQPSTPSNPGSDGDSTPSDVERELS